MIQDLQNMLVRHEQLRLKPYRDNSKLPGFEGRAGKLTIGIGRNLDDNGITEAEAMLLLSNDISNARNDCQNFDWFSRLDSVRQDVVIDMVFNMGVIRFKGFVRMIAALSNGDYAAAADEMLQSTWAQQVGLRASELSHMMRTGEYVQK